MYTVNVLSLIILVLFIIPIFSGAFKARSKEKVDGNLVSLFTNFEFLLAIIISFILVKLIFFSYNKNLFSGLIYHLIPSFIRTPLYGQDILTYILVLPFVFIAVILLLRVLFVPIYKNFIIPASDALQAMVGGMRPITRRFFNALFQLPTSVCLVIVYGLILNFYSYYSYSPMLSEVMSESNLYKALYSVALQRMISPNIAKDVAVINNDSFKKDKNTLGEQDKGDTGNNFALQIGDKLSGKNPLVIKYFNGSSLGDAVKSIEEIDKTARQLVGTEKKSRLKAEKLYTWITKNISYDYDKAIIVAKDPKGIPSGAVIAYSTKKGICFDFASLFVAMCRATGVKVRFMTGVAYSGVSWGDHAWNQIYSEEERRWINVDTTFGIGDNYFDRSEFYVDHADEQIQNEW